MPRINIEDAFWFDERVKALERKIGRFTAHGMLLNFFRLAQEQFKNGNYISDIQFKLGEFTEDLFEFGLAERTDKGIKCVGDDVFFSWLISRQCAGRNGAKVTNSKRWIKSESSEINNLVSANVSKRQQTSASSSSSSSSSKEEETTKKLPKGNVTSSIAQFIGFFVKAYQGRYGPNTRPELGPKVQGQIKNFLKDRPLEESITLIQVFMQMNDPWFVKKCHDFSTFLENLQKVKLSFETGQEVGMKRSRSIREILAEDERGLVK